MTSIPEAIFQLQHAFKEAGLEPPAKLVLASREQEITLVRAINDYDLIVDYEGGVEFRIYDLLIESL